MAGAMTIDFELLMSCKGLESLGGDDGDKAGFDSTQLAGAGGILVGLTMTSYLLELINSGAFRTGASTWVGFTAESKAPAR